MQRLHVPVRASAQASRAASFQRRIGLSGPLVLRRQPSLSPRMPTGIFELKAAPVQSIHCRRRLVQVPRASAGEATPAEEDIPRGLFKHVASLEKQTYINSVIISAFIGSILVKFLTVDVELKRGWTLWEFVRDLPADNWAFYQHCLKEQPLFTPMLITGATYLIADWIAQTYEGNALLNFRTERLLSSTITGLIILGPLAHFYYTTQDAIFLDIWPSSPLYSEVLKMLIDNTFYCFVYNFLYYLSQGLLKGRSVQSIVTEFKGAWWRLQKAGWRIWPFVGVITHTIIPTEHKVLFVDAIEVGWVTFLSLSANAKRTANKEAVEDLMTADEGVVQGEQSAAAVEALETYVSEVRETSWVSELTPIADEAVLPADSMPQDHMILANELENAISDKLSNLETAALTYADSDQAALIPPELLQGGVEDQQMATPIENLVAEGIASMMTDTEQAQKQNDAADITVEVNETNLS